MLFSVIYSVDVPKDGSIREYAPPNVRKLWEQTEGDEQYEYSYLEGKWKKGRHRKWCAVLTREQFDKFVEKLSLYAERTETMGSLGAPGLGYGVSPAISFTDNRYSSAILGAYVTPLPDKVRQKQEHPFTERDWERVRRAVLKVYG